jgi:glutamine amidotransferase
VTVEKEIAVVDYGVNNIGSVLNMLRRLDVAASAARAPVDLAGKAAIVLPGIGAFDAGVRNLKAAGLFDAIKDEVLMRGTPILGICLGMQLLTRGSEEGTLEGLRLVGATTKRLRLTNGSSHLKIPHMGWNETECVDRELFAGLESPRFYYVHSYHVVCDEPADVAARCTYGAPFHAAVRRGSVMGTQFHPEKSHRFGMGVLGNFARIAGLGSPRPLHA